MPSTKYTDVKKTKKSRSLDTHSWAEQSSTKNAAMKAVFAGVSREPLFFSHCIVASVHLVDTKKTNYSDLLNNHAAIFIPIIGIKFAA